jgi:hypothetical protein
VNNFPVGRSVDESLRVLEAFQFVAEHGEVCPANWKPGDATIKPTPNDSLEFFETQGDDDDVAPTLTGVQTVEEYEEKLAAGNKVGVLSEVHKIKRETVLTDAHIHT